MPSRCTCSYTSCQAPCLKRTVVQDTTSYDSYLDNLLRIKGKDCLFVIPVPVYTGECIKVHYVLLINIRPLGV